MRLTQKSLDLQNLEGHKALGFGLGDADGAPEAVSPAGRARVTGKGLCRGTVRGRGGGGHEGGRRLMRVYTPLNEPADLSSGACARI